MSRVTRGLPPLLGSSSTREKREAVDPIGADERRHWNLQAARNGPHVLVQGGTPGCRASSSLYLAARLDSLLCPAKTLPTPAANFSLLPPTSPSCLCCLVCSP
eukprot:scaffold197352_cov28-Tisochrysis_lutea.AAC.1